jgi:nucleotide-binding universal stress UspA family protein
MSVPTARPPATIACCVDDSDASTAALAQAAALAEAAGAQLLVVHVMPSADAFTGGRTPWSLPAAQLAGDIMEEGRRWLDGRMQAAGVADAEQVLLQDDDEAEAVCRWAEEAGCDLLVAAAHRRGLARALLGSFTSHLARNAPCSVLVVRVDAGARAGG